jgi:excisionase family DNA binding protein
MNGYVTTDAAALRLRTTPRKVRSMVSRGELGAGKVGNTVLIEEASVAALAPFLEHAMTTAEASARLGVGPRQIRYLVEAGKLSAVKVGGRLMVKL